jgi:outer membrane immunogenic protein
MDLEAYRVADFAYPWGLIMRRILCATFAIVGFASVSSAADLPVKAPVYRAPVAVSHTWTGCYLGGNAGYGWARVNWYDPQFLADTGSNTSNGAVAGGQIGCDYQTGNIVVGVQGMLDWANMDGSHIYSLGSPFYTDHTKVSWFATLTGRIGYAVLPAALIYAKGGAAWVADTFTETCPAAGCPGEAKSTRSGWTLGGGLEYRFHPNWSVFVEYNYMDFGRRRSTITYVNQTTFNYDIKQEMQTVLVGLNYRFGGGMF